MPKTNSTKSAKAPRTVANEKRAKKPLTSIPTHSCCCRRCCCCCNSSYDSALALPLAVSWVTLRLLLPLPLLLLLLPLLLLLSRGFTFLNTNPRSRFTCGAQV